MDEERFKYANDPADPGRCQAVTRAGQCTMMAITGFTYCIAHGGNKAVEAKAKENLRNYQLTKFRAQMERQVDSPVIKSLQEEIGLLRMLIETRINSCSDTSDLLMNSTVIADLVGRVERVVVSCNKLDERLGGMLDKNKAIQLANDIVAIVSKHITDDALLTAIADEIGSALVRITAEPNED